MHDKCMSYKNSLSLINNLEDIIPFNYKIINKKRHECILKKKGICEFPSEDCSHISGNIIKINDKIPTSDVRVIKWLTGYTVEANFFEDAHISNSLVKNKSLKLGI